MHVCHIAGRPKLLDVCCGAGGAAKGYADAGFDVYGIDNEDMPNYPGAFVQGSAVDVFDDDTGELVEQGSPRQSRLGTRRPSASHCSQS